MSNLRIPKIPKYLVEGIGLVSPSDEDHDLSGVHDGADTNGEGLLGDLGKVSVEKPGVGLDRVLQ